MKCIPLLLAAMAFSISCLAQKPAIKWGEEFKLRKGSTDLDVIYTDKSGVYLQEGHLALKSYFVIGATARASASLIKLDKDFVEIYHNDFNKELRGKEFVQFFVCQDKMYLVASEYSKRDRNLAIYAAEVDKNAGELSGSFKPVTNFQKEEKSDDIEFKITLSADSAQVVVVSSVQGKERNEYQIQEFDKDMKAAGKPIMISNEFEPKKFQLEDVLYTINKRVILVGRRYEYEEGKKKKDKFLDFANYNIRMYDEKGKQLTEINTNINGKWLTSTKLLQEKNKDLVLAGFYSNEKKGKTIDGLLVQRIDPVAGKVISTSDKPINNSLLNENKEDSVSDDADGEEESKAERKERERLNKLKDEGEGLSKYMQFRNIFYTSDNGIIILAEQFHHYVTTTQSYSPGTNGMPGQWRTTTYSVYLSGDLMMCKVDGAGNIGWMQVLPKAQREVIMGGSSYGSGITFGTSFFGSFNMPFYSGFAAIQTGKSIQVIFNDNPANAGVTQAGQKAKGVSSFSNSQCFVLSLDEATGKFTRKLFFKNKEVPTAMPRLGSVIGDEMYIVGKTDRLMGKSKVAVAKITMK